MSKRENLAKEKLIRAARKGALREVERALSMGGCDKGRWEGFAKLMELWGSEEGSSEREACALAIIKAGMLLSGKQEHTCSALHCAVMFGATERVIRALAEAGALINEGDIFGRTPLHWAVINGRLGACSALIELGADESIMDSQGATPLSLLDTERRVEAASAARRALAEREAKLIESGLGRSALAKKRAGL